MTLAFGSVASVKWKLQYGHAGTARLMCFMTGVVCMCHRLDNTLSSSLFTIISTHPAPVIYRGRDSEKEREIKQTMLK